jgi:hypothetical protein
MSSVWNGSQWVDRPARSRLLTIRVTGEEREQAELVAKHRGTNVARMVRKFFRDEAKRIEEEQKAESLQNASKSEESRAPRPPPGFRPTKSARKAPEGRPPRAAKARKPARR